MEKLWCAGFFDSRHIVCQITGKNSAKFKNYVKNRFCGRAHGAQNQHFKHYELALGPGLAVGAWGGRETRGMRAKRAFRE